LPSLGTANIAAGLLQTFPVSSSGSRTAIAAALGGRSLLYSIVAPVVLGSRGHSGLAGNLLGSVSGHVLRHAACPVEIVREQVSPS
jgi:hypothetical protein